MKVHTIEGYDFDSNIYVIPGSITVLIDAGTGKHFKQVSKDLKNFDLSPRDIDLLINTHCHYDHVGGDLDFIEASNCDLAIHKEDAKPVIEGDPERTLASQFDEEIEPLKVSRVLVDRDYIELGESVLEVIHTPGHSPGSISLYEPTEKILFSGDTVFKNGIGRLGLPGSDSEAMKESLEKLAEKKVNKLYPGHGPIATEDGGKYVQMGMNFF
ncbi:MAG: MBL fold metallo-hydrolase [Hadesarchaea archaeon]|nr:MBL fold metallo-hydrolase [Hadesarchaea archaeon]